MGVTQNYRKTPTIKHAIGCRAFHSFSPLIWLPNSLINCGRHSDTCELFAHALSLSFSVRGQRSLTHPAAFFPITQTPFIHSHLWLRDAAALLPCNLSAVHITQIKSHTLHTSWFLRASVLIYGTMGRPSWVVLNNDPRAQGAAPKVQRRLCSGCSRSHHRLCVSA